MPNIIPITELRDTNKIAELCGASKEPIYITKNGYGTMVLLNIQAYEAEQEELLVLKRLLSAKSGNTVDADKVMTEFKEKYGL